MEKNLTSISGGANNESSLGPKTQPQRVSEAIAHSFEGMHDYISNLRILGFELSRNGLPGLCAYIKEHPLESFEGYRQRVSGTNPDLKSKIDRDIARYPGIEQEAEALINILNTATSEKVVMDVYTKLQTFFKKD